MISRNESLFETLTFFPLERLHSVQFLLRLSLMKLLKMLFGIHISRTFPATLSANVELEGSDTPFPFKNVQLFSLAAFLHYPIRKVDKSMAIGTS